MILRKNRPKCSPTHFLSQLIHNLHLGKSSPEIWATSVVFEKLPKENNRPKGEN
jgi:hypothetical protein